ncbi:helix-turn-helix domain-containing protein [Luteolibacter sp. Populi]|uniref:helix-turn-helix domain-containing protein n=1 Tax=Luteolibacter sp. Populi TaxID=3230487 RepID=UPI003467ABA5
MLHAWRRRKRRDLLRRYEGKTSNIEHPTSNEQPKERQSAAARRLGIHRQSLQRKLRKFSG